MKLNMEKIILRLFILMIVSFIIGGTIYLVTGGMG
jgi:hypothetical protein